MNAVENQTPNPTPLQQTIAWAKAQGAHISSINAEIFVETFQNKTLVSIDTHEYEVQGIFLNGENKKYSIAVQTDPCLLSIGNIIYYTHEHLCPPTLRGLDKVSAS